MSYPVALVTYAGKTFFFYKIIDSPNGKAEALTLPWTLPKVFGLKLPGTHNCWIWIGTGC